MATLQKSDDFGVLQEFVEGLFASDPDVEYSRLEVIMEAEAFGLNEDLLEVVNLLPPIALTRDKLCSQLNSSLSSHGWGYVYGAVH